jgi:tetratricopeptide (TPR) repeat protein
MLTRYAIVLVLLLITGVEAAEKHKKGSYKLQGMSKIDDGSGGHIEFVNRMGWESRNNTDGELTYYEIKDITSEVFVPDDYDKEVPYGLIIWINSSQSGKIPDSYKALMKKHKLIWAGANKGGNNVFTNLRVNMAKDTRANMMELYNIDPNRVYISGNSGGARASSLAAFSFPELFKGGIFCIAVECWEDVPLSGNSYRATKWKKTIPSKRLALMKKEGRYALMTGDKDYNQESIKYTYDKVFSKRFKNAEYYQVPGLGHARIPAEWYEKAIIQMDIPLKLMAKEYLDKAQRLNSTKKYAEAARYYQRAIAYNVAGAQDEYDKLVSQKDEHSRKAKDLLDDGSLYQAYMLYKKLVSVYGEFATDATAHIALVESDQSLKDEISADAYYVRAEKSHAKNDTAGFKKYLASLMKKFPDSKAVVKAKAKWPGSLPAQK